LRAHIGLINSKELKKMTTMVDVGSECFVQAKMFVWVTLSSGCGLTILRSEDTSRIFVHVGMGFHAEMTLDEALKFITSKEAELNAKADKITEEAAAIKDKIRMVYETLDWLMQIPESARPRREMF
jgi:prefoldin subunit 5